MGGCGCGCGCIEPLLLGHEERYLIISPVSVPPLPGGSPVGMMGPGGYKSGNRLGLLESAHARIDVGQLA